MKSKNKKTVIIKHIHSCFASASSNDVWLYNIIAAKDIDFVAKEESHIKSEKHSFINNAIVDEVSEDKFLSVVYLKSDKTFSKKGLAERNFIGEGYHNTQEFLDLVKYYIEKGFKSTERPEELIKFYRRREEKEMKRLKAAGHVLWMDYKDRKPEDYKGGFSDEVFKEMFDYVSRGAVFGWVGHMVRTAVLDKAIEEGLRKRGLSCSKMVNWITSGDGRHFGDSLEDLKEKEQLKKIEKYLNSMFNLCLIYGEKSHKGTLDSTQEIRVQLKEKGWLLPE